MSINWLVLVGVVVVQYVIGALWYSVIFGKQWMQINHPNGLPSVEEMKKLGDEATPSYAIQLLLTIATVAVQYYFMDKHPMDWLMTSFLIWFGFLAPIAIQGVIWSDPQNKKKALQIGILCLNYLVTAIIAGYLIATFG
jgi:Protein of unknown function (DUF1761)